MPARQSNWIFTCSLDYGHQANDQAAWCRAMRRGRRMLL